MKINDKIVTIFTGFLKIYNDKITPVVTIYFQIGTSTHLFENNSPLSFVILAPCSILSSNIKHLMIKLHFHNCLKFFEHHLPPGQNRKKNSRKRQVCSEEQMVSIVESYIPRNTVRALSPYHNMYKGSFNFYQSLCVYGFNTIYYPN